MHRPENVEQGQDELKKGQEELKIGQEELKQLLREVLVPTGAGLHL